MTHSIDTEVRGQPGELRDSAEKLRGYVTPVVATLGDTLVAARRGAEDTWSSPAGEAFTTRVSDLIDPVDQLETYLGEAASGLDLLAGDLEQAQRSMEAIRSDAVAASLSVNGFVIEDPGPPLPDPGPVPTDADTHAVAAHADQTAAYNTQRARLDAFTAAAAEAAEIRSKEATAARAWSDIVARKQQLKLVFVAGDFGVSVAQGVVSERGKRHHARSQQLLDRSRQLAKDARGLAGYDARRAAFDEGRRLRGAAAVHQAGWRSANSRSQALGRLGGVMAVGAVAYDVAVLDKPWHQAVVSGGAGFGASVAAGAATGALIGSIVPVPLVGTVFGAAVGTGIGIWTSGAVDSLFEDADQGVGKAAAAGWSAVTATTNDALDAIGSTWDALF